MKKVKYECDINDNPGCLGIENMMIPSPDGSGPPVEKTFEESNWFILSTGSYACPFCSGHEV